MKEEVRRLSTHQPSITISAPQYHFRVAVRPTGDTEIDQGVEEVLSRQDGVSAVSGYFVDSGTVIYDVAVSEEYSGGVGLIQQRSAEALEKYYLVRGVRISIQLSAGLQSTA